ncbi:ATP-binding protein [Geminocystis sp. GBBB08]|uniref:ATP-binding protein n=1 Tax=Geminocystis sp. GBBB08 TaxID=2604140 RepID=UPI0027E35664|nr:ATP-binding protein [Geminocystis sp. GBBB08]MBL1208930.1 GAF domain-containing protein [Geminocystis sp. GBBB08]
MNYDHQEIQLLGTIQPHGVLIILNDPELTICQVSQNTEKWLGYQPNDLINKHISLLLNEKQVEAITNCLKKDFNYINPLDLKIKKQFFQGIIHSFNNFIFLELEIINQSYSSNFFQFYQVTNNIIKKLQKTKNLMELSTIIVAEIRKLTEFDRVMIYRFEDNKYGHVIAEAKRENLDSFFNLHYPETDIPLKARYLFSLNFLRVIPDVYYQPVLLLNHPETNEIFDLSYSVLRGVSPCHLEYLKNMGVKSSMTISIINNNHLWGLIACHNYSPKYVPYDIRTVCEFLGKIMSIELPAKEENEYLNDKISLKNIQTNLINSLSKSTNLIDSLINNGEQIQNLVNGNGVAICADDELFLFGKTPSEKEIYHLIDFLEIETKNDIYYTNNLSKIYEKAQGFKDVASGILLLTLTRVTRYYIIWFRGEVIQTVKWAGNPYNSIKIEADGITLSPRNSFQEWQEKVKFQSLPWQKYEIQEAIEFKNAVVGIILQKADELASLNLELQTINQELDAFTYIASHDLKEPLRGIYNYSTFLLEDYENILDQDGKDKLNTLLSLTKRMEGLIEALLEYSRIGRTGLTIKPINLTNLINNITKMLKASYQEKNWEIIISKTLPNTQGDPILIEELLTNLITNGLKYNHQQQKVIEIGYLTEQKEIEIAKSKIIFYIKDNGMGIQEKHFNTIFRIFKRLHGQNQYGGGNGVGLTIVKRIIERHGGNIWLESVYGEGTTFYFTLP